MIEVSKENYIKHRNDINILFHMFCIIRELTPTEEEMEIISQFLNVAKLVEVLDRHFKVDYLFGKKGELIKLM